MTRKKERKRKERVEEGDNQIKRKGEEKKGR